MFPALDRHDCPLQAGTARVLGTNHTPHRRRLLRQFDTRRSPRPARWQSETQLRVQAVALPRNWHALRMDVKYKIVNLQDQFWAFPFVAAAVQRYNKLQQPITAVILKIVSAVTAWWSDVIYDYDNFCTAENTREWRWRKKRDHEWNMWSRILLACVALFLTCLWEAVTPTSIFLAIVPPLFLSWVMYQNWLLSPIILGLIFMLPLKFPTWNPSWRWF